MPEAGQNMFSPKMQMDIFARPFADDLKPVLRLCNYLIKNTHLRAKTTFETF